MNTATDTMIDTKQRVCVRWDIYRGYYYVGPFAAPDEAGDWAVKNQRALWWQTEQFDPNIALEVRAPANCQSWSRIRQNRTGGPSGRPTSAISIC
jgi:hypothetical protein